MKIHGILFSFFLCLSLFITSTVGAASKKLEAYFIPNVYSVGESSDKLLARPGVREAIVEALKDKISLMSSAGKLPFALKSEKINLSNTREDFSDNMAIGLLPLMMLDSSFTSEYYVESQKFYKAIITSSLSLAICSAEPELKGWRILAIVPMNGYRIIGDANEPKRTPITASEEADVFISLNRAMINDQLDFSKTAKFLKDWQTKSLIPNTYQVTAVDMSSKGAKEVFGGAKDGEVKSIIGNFFTAEYARKTGKVMYPPLISENYAKTVGDGLRAFTWHSPSGAVEMTFSEPKHKIRLDFSGIASQEFQRKDESDARKDIIYKAWLKGSIDNGEALTLDKFTSRIYPGKANASVFKYDEKDIYTEIMLSLPVTMAQKLSKGK